MKRKLVYLLAIMATTSAYADNYCLERVETLTHSLTNSKMLSAITITKKSPDAESPTTLLNATAFNIKHYNLSDQNPHVFIDYTNQEVYNKSANSAFKTANGVLNVNCNDSLTFTFKWNASDISGIDAYLFADWDGNGTFEESECVAWTYYDEDPDDFGAVPGMNSDNHEEAPGKIWYGTLPTNGEYVFGYGNHRNPIVVPGTATLGNTRLRLVLQNNSKDACGAASIVADNGTIIDFAMNIANTADIPTVSTTTAKVFPNPAQDKIQVELSETVSSISIVNAVGQLLTTRPQQGNITTIDVEGYAAGIYFIKIEKASGAEVLKFVKQ
jgi:hypothetical protein